MAENQSKTEFSLIDGHSLYDDMVWGFLITTSVNKGSERKKRVLLLEEGDLFIKKICGVPSVIYLYSDVGDHFVAERTEETDD